MERIELSGRARDLTGGVFGKLSAQYPVERDKHGKIKWLCVCECGAECVVASSDLATGHTKSCGCSRIGVTGSPKHGMYGTPTYLSWRSMMSRCYNENATGYEHWGGRGIRVCPQWHTFQRFYDDMGERPAGKSIDRTDNNGDYNPRNCRWATPSEQNSNKRPSHRAKWGVCNVRQVGPKSWEAHYGSAYLGRFSSPWDAICARKSAELAVSNVEKLVGQISG